MLNSTIEGLEEPAKIQFTNIVKIATDVKFRDLINQVSQLKEQEEEGWDIVNPLSQDELSFCENFADMLNKITEELSSKKLTVRDINDLNQIIIKAEAQFNEFMGTKAQRTPLGKQLKDIDPTQTMLSGMARNAKDLTLALEDMKDEAVVQIIPPRYVATPEPKRPIRPGAYVPTPEPSRKAEGGRRTPPQASPVNRAQPSPVDPAAATRKGSDEEKKGPRARK